jgi:ribonuclease G
LKQILISSEKNLSRIAVLVQGRLEDLHVETGKTDQLVGNIYRARVVNVLPSAQSAFLDIGADKNAYMYIDDAIPPGQKANRQGKEKPNIRHLVQVGEERLVQVMKEAQGTKAARVTTEISIPGRMLVYLPDSARISISRRIQAPAERKRLEQTAARLLTGSEGVIFRTQAEGADEQRIADELCYLRSVWSEALAAAAAKKLPVLVHPGDDLITRAVRDLFSADVDELIVDHGPTFQRVKQMLLSFYPDLADRLSLYQGKLPLFEQYAVEAEIDKALRRQVWLKSGGSIVIDRTEAMTVIDVNTGKFTGGASMQLEELVTRTNLEAAREIARQLRLRDIGGIVIIDFIDMKSSANQARLLAELESELARDRTVTSVLGLTKLGLVELTRKKVRQSLSEALTSPCPTCGGKGRVLSLAEVSRRLEREIRALVKTGEAEAVVVELSAELARHWQEPVDGTARSQRVEQDLQIRLHLLPEARLPVHAYRVRYTGTKQEADRLLALEAGEAKFIGDSSRHQV